MFPDIIESAIEHYKKLFKIPILEAISHYLKSDGVSDETIFVRLNYLTDEEINLIKTFHYDYDYLIRTLDEQTQRKKLASRKFTNKLVILGHTLLTGIGVDKDEITAYACFKLAAEAQHPIALNNIGWMYAQGVYLPKDNVIALKYYVLGKQGKSKIAELNYARIGELEETERIRIKHHNPFDYVSLANSEEENENVEGAIDLNTRALALIGEVEALVGIGRLYIDNPDLSLNHLALGRKCFKLCASRHKMAAWELGTIYQNGIGVEQDLEKAETYYLFAAKRLYANACYRLGLIYQTQAPAKSAYYFRLNCEQAPNNSVAARKELLACGPSNATPAQLFHALTVTGYTYDPPIARKWAYVEEMLLTCNQENKTLLAERLNLFSCMIRIRFAFKLHLLKSAWLLTDRNDSVGKLPLSVFLHIFKYVMGDQIMLQFLNKALLTSALPSYQDWQTEYRAFVVVLQLEQHAKDTYGRYYWMSKTGVTLFGQHHRSFTVTQSKVQAAHEGKRRYQDVLENIKRTLK